MTNVQTSPFDSALSGFAALPYFVLCVGIYLLAFALRRVVETLVPRAASNRFWTELALPVLPLLIGAGVCLALKSFPYPAGLTAWGWRALVGICCGGFSGFLYRIAKAFFTKAGGPDTGSGGGGGGGDAIGGKPLP